MIKDIKNHTKCSHQPAIIPKLDKPEPISEFYDKSEIVR
jgi:hypothetical protein